MITVLKFHLVTDQRLSSMSSSKQNVGKLFLLAASLYLVLNVWKIMLEERNLNYSEPRNATQWAVELKNKGKFRKNLTHQSSLFSDFFSNSEFY